MKNPNIKVYLYDMQEAVNEILFLMKNVSLLQFKDNNTLRLAVERLFEILGEAANRIPKESQSLYSQIPWFKIIGMRNIIIHSYDKIDYEQLYLTVLNDLLNLKIELDKII